MGGKNNRERGTLHVPSPPHADPNCVWRGFGYCQVLPLHHKPTRKPTAKVDLLVSRYTAALGGMFVNRKNDGPGASVESTWARPSREAPHPTQLVGCHHVGQSSDDQKWSGRIWPQRPRTPGRTAPHACSATSMPGPSPLTSRDQPTWWGPAKTPTTWRTGWDDADDQDVGGEFHQVPGDDPEGHIIRLVQQTKI